MKQRKWTVEEKVAIVIEGLKMQKEGQKSIESGRYQNLHYKWWDKFTDVVLKL